jgi:hypothetical protein
MWSRKRIYPEPSNATPAARANVQNTPARSISGTTAGDNSAIVAARRPLHAWQMSFPTSLTGCTPKHARVRGLHLRASPAYTVNAVCGRRAENHIRAGAVDEQERTDRRDTHATRNKRKHDAHPERDAGHKEQRSKKCGREPQLGWRWRRGMVFGVPSQSGVGEMPGERRTDYDEEIERGPSA